MSYAVFVLEHGRWSLWQTYQSRANAQQELAYLVDMLGCRAKIFKRTR